MVTGTKFPDIVAFATQNGITFSPKKKKSGDEAYALCPLCNCGKYKLSLNPAKNCFRCWHCGEYGGIARFIALLEGVSEQEVIDRYRSERTKHIHPALKLTHEQRRLIGLTRTPDWETMRSRDPKYYKRSLDHVWRLWTDKLQECREEAYSMLFIAIATGEIERPEKKLRLNATIDELERRLHVPLRNELRAAYRNKPEWAKVVERRIEQLIAIQPSSAHSDAQHVG